MNMQYIRYLLIVTGLLIIGLSFYSAISRDIIYKHDYNSDLRNRVIGARMIADGKSPYFYKWKKADGIEYYDPNGFIDGSVSAITASPFFHRLLIPLSGLPQSKIEDIWLPLEYLVLGIITLISISLSSTALSKGLVFTVAIAFLFTDAWKYHIIQGQSYLFIPFFLAIFTWLLCKRSNRNLIFFAMGSFALMLILMRPNFAIFFLPFFFLFRDFTKKKIAFFAVPFVIAGLFTILNPSELKLWKDYISAIKQHTLIHQDEPHKTGYINEDPKYVEWEGLDMRKVSFLKPDMPIYPRSENGNIFVLYKFATHKKIGIKTLMISSFLLIGLLLALILPLHTRLTINSVNLKNIILFGFCLYMITDFFSPIYRNQYYTTQWIFAIMLFLSTANYKKHYFFYAAIIAGIVLNILRVPFIKMEHTIGEYLIFAALLIFSLRFLNSPATIEK